MKKILLMLLALFIVGCTKTVTIEYDTNGVDPIENRGPADEYTLKKIQTKTVKSGDWVEIASSSVFPLDVRDYFLGWYDEGTDEQLRFIVQLTKDTKLIAKWATEEEQAKIDADKEAKVQARKEEEEKQKEADKKYINPEFQKEAEANAREHVAKAGKVLVHKGDHDFMGMKYYFKGELIANETFEGNDIWLLKNEHGYIMPVDHMHFQADIGDQVEVWGNLSGEGYTLNGYDNVVGETGFINASFATVNDEIQY